MIDNIFLNLSFALVKYTRDELAAIPKSRPISSWL
jgi:hypothetical protein